VTDLVPHEQTVLGGLEIAANLPAKSISLVGLDLDGTELTFNEWEGIGRGLGHAHRWTAFALGDWLLWGVDVFGEERVASSVDGPVDRYNVASRITGLHPDTLRNYMSLSARVARSRRRVELPALTHEPVGKLPPDQQEYWLQLAVDNAWTREELRAAINGPKTTGPGGAMGKRDKAMVFMEQVEYQARRVIEAAEETEDGVLVPAHVWGSFVAALDGDVDG